MSVISGLSLNRPKLWPSAAWDPIGTTLIGNATIGVHTYGLFINTNDTIFVPIYDQSLVYIWPQGNKNSSNILPANNSYPYSIFVTDPGDIYLGSLGPRNQVDVWSFTGSGYIPSSPLLVGSSCSGLFVGANDLLYCSLSNDHKVIRRSLNSNDSQLETVAGTGCPGILSATLMNPEGIFVDTNSDLYIADRSNDRAQLFHTGHTDGITVAGRGAPGTIDLRQPRGVTLDADGYLFIVDCGHDRIVGSDRNGFRCVVRCGGSWGPGPDELDSAVTMAFDSHGNIFAADRDNNRVQYFWLLTDPARE